MRSLGVIMLLVGIVLRVLDGGGLPIINPLDPAPFDIPGNRCLVLYESAELSKLSPKQLSVIQGGAVREYLTEHCVDGPDGSPEFRFWDLSSDKTLEFAPDAWKRAIEKAKSAPNYELPFVVVSNGKSGTMNPLPEDTDATLAMLRRYFE